MARSKYVAKGVPGGWGVWDVKRNRWWGDFYETQPDLLIKELNGERNGEKLNKLALYYKRTKR